MRGSAIGGILVMHASAGFLRCVRHDRRGSGNSAQIGGRVMARTTRRSGVKEVALSEIKDDLSRFLREAAAHEIGITRHGTPAGVLTRFESDEDWIEYRPDHG